MYYTKMENFLLINFYSVKVVKSNLVTVSSSDVPVEQKLKTLPKASIVNII